MSGDLLTHNNVSIETFLLLKKTATDGTVRKGPGGGREEQVLSTCFFSGLCDVNQSIIRFNTQTSPGVYTLTDDSHAHYSGGGTNWLTSEPSWFNPV